MVEIPLLKAEDVEVRVAQLQQTNYGVYANLLVYKNARVDMRILDSVFGPLNWKREHEVIGDQMYCTVSVWDNEKQAWVGKQDLGTESNTEAAKGQSSDAFKRACFSWGIGRELYEAPSIRVKLDDSEVSTGPNGKPRTYAKFRVSSMAFDKETNCFTELTVIDEKGTVRFSLKAQVSAKPKDSKPSPKVTEEYTPFSAPEYESNECACVVCRSKVSTKVAQFSRNRFNKVLCFHCQKGA